MTHYVLPRALQPLRDESLPGLIMRNAESYRFRDPAGILSRINPPKPLLWSISSEDPSSRFGQALKHLLGLDDERFARLSLWAADENELLVLGQPTWRHLVTADRRIVCPLCLKDSAHHHTIWTVNVLPVCASHGVWLHDRCHGCSRPLEWRGSQVHRCSHLNCLKDIRTAPVEDVDPMHLEGIIGLNRIFHADDPMAVSPIGLPPGQALRLSLLFGKAVFGFERASRTPGFVQRERARVPEVMDAGWQALQDWPRGFYALLDRLREKAPTRSGKDGLRKAFGILPNWIHEWAREPWGNPIGAAFADYVSASGTIATSRTTIQRYAPGVEVKQHFRTATDAHRAIGVSPGAVRKAAFRRDVYSLEPKGMGTASLISEADLEILREAAVDSLSTANAMKVVGVGRKVFDQLEAAGLVRHMPEVERILDTRPFSKAAMQKFVDACIGKAPQLAAGGNSGEKLSSVISATAPGRTVADICRALTDGRIEPVGRQDGKVGLLQIRLRLADVELVLPSAKETMSAVDASKVFGVDYQHLNVWVKAGLLQTVRSDRPGEHGVRITDQDLADFRRDFVTGGELAREMDQPTNYRISSHLKFLGVRPVSGPGVNGGKLALFRRAEVGRDMLDAVLRLQAGAAGTPQDKHRASFARVAQVAAVVAQRWDANLQREHNTFTDLASGRVLQVVSGRRPDLTGVFVFHVHNTSMERLRAVGEVWVALVAGDSEEFLLAPLEQVPWKGQALNASYVRIRFDGRGRAMEMREWVGRQ